MSADASVGGRDPSVTAMSGGAAGAGLNAGVGAAVTDATKAGEFGYGSSLAGAGAGMGSGSSLAGAGAGMGSGLGGGVVNDPGANIDAGLFNSADSVDGDVGLLLADQIKKQQQEQQRQQQREQGEEQERLQLKQQLVQVKHMDSDTGCLLHHHASP